MKIGHWNMAQRWRNFKRPASSKGMWKQFVADNQWPVKMAEGGVPQLVQPGPGRQGYGGKYSPGVRYRPERNKAKPYEVVKDGKTVAKFKTEKEAAEAYKKLKIPKGKIGLSVNEFKELRLKHKNLSDSGFIKEVIKDKYTTEYGGKFDRQAVGVYNESAGISKQVAKDVVPRKIGEIKKFLSETKEGKQSIKLYNEGKLSLEDLRLKANQRVFRKKLTESGFYKTPKYLEEKREYEQTPKARKRRQLYNKAKREAFENKYGVWTSGNTPKDRFWRSLYTSTKGQGPSRLQLVKETVPKKFKGTNVKDVKFYDTKTGKTFGYNNLQNYINKNVGKGAYEKVLTPFKEKFFLNETLIDYKGKNVNLNQLLNQTLIPNYSPGNPFHTSMQVHHPYGINRNPFVTQLLAYDKNAAEFRPREAVIPDMKKATTFGEKRKVLENFIKKSDPKVLTGPGKKLYGTDVDISTKVKDLYKAQGKSLPVEVANVLQDAGIPCIKGAGGQCTRPEDYRKGFNEVVQRSAAGDEKALTKLQKFTQTMKKLKGPAKWTGYGLLGEIGFMVPFALADYASGESWKRIIGNASDLGFGPMFGQSEDEEIIANLPEDSLWPEAQEALAANTRLKALTDPNRNFPRGRIGMDPKRFQEAQTKTIEEADLDFLTKITPFMEGPRNQYLNSLKLDEAFLQGDAARDRINKQKEQRLKERRDRGFIAEEGWQENFKGSRGYGTGGIVSLLKK